MCSDKFSLKHAVDLPMNMDVIIRNNSFRLSPTRYTYALVRNISYPSPLCIRNVWMDPWRYIKFSNTCNYFYINVHVHKHLYTYMYITHMVKVS